MSLCNETIQKWGITHFIFDVQNGIYCGVDKKRLVPVAGWNTHESELPRNALIVGVFDDSTFETLLYPAPLLLKDFKVFYALCKGTKS